MKKGMMLFVSWMILLFQFPWYDYSSVYAEQENTAKVISIAAGGGYSLALKEDGSVWAWGAGQTFLIQVKDLTDVTAIAAGMSQSLALKLDGTVWTWRAGQTPIQVKDLTDVVAIAAGSSYSLALKRDGTVWAWEWNLFGQLGDGTNEDRLTPVQVQNLTDVVAIAAGRYHSLALKQDGTVWVWGDGQTFPIQMKDLTDVVAIAAGNEYSLALKRDGTVWRWGLNDEALFRYGWTTEDRSTPVQVENLTDVASIAAGWLHSLALKKDGTVWAWGRNESGQLGDGTEEGYSATPVHVKDLTDVVAIAAGENHSLALKGDGTLWEWGSLFHSPVHQVKGFAAANGSEPVQLDSPVPIQITNQQPAEQVHAVPKNVAPLSDAYTVTSAAPLAKETKLTIKVDPAKLAGVDPYKVAIWKFIETPSTGKKEKTSQTAALNGYWESIGGKVDLSTSSVSSYITEYGTYAVMLSNQTIADIQDHPYKYEIEVLLAQGIIKGYSETEFRPDQGISRAEFAKVIVKAAHYPLGNENAAFKDVPNGHWATRYIEAAQRAGAIKGYSATQFMPNNLISREQAVTIVGRAGQLGTLNSQEIEAQLKGYRDGTSISDYARGYFAEAIKRNMIADQEGSLQPQQPATRAVIAKMIMALMIRLGYL